MMYTYVDQNGLAQRRKALSGCVLGRSVLNELDRRMTFEGVGVKYVITGTEHYVVNGRQYDVGAGSYLLVNAACEGRVRIDQQEPVVGLCAQLPFDLMDQVVASYQRPDELEGWAPEDYFSTEAFMEEVVQDSGTRIGMAMQALIKEPLLCGRVDRAIGRAFFVRLAEALIHDHWMLARAITRIPAVRSATRKEIYRRVQWGLSFIHDNYAGLITVQEMASAAAMSEFHFHRVFRAVVGVSPYQYMRELRLRHAHALLLHNEATVGTVAEMCGFADIHAFSKAFRARFGVAPSTVCGSSRN